MKNNNNNNNHLFSVYYYKVSIALRLVSKNLPIEKMRNDVVGIVKLNDNDTN